MARSLGMEPLSVEDDYEEYEEEEVEKDVPIDQEQLFDEFEDNLAKHNPSPLPSNVFGYIFATVIVSTNGLRDNGVHHCSRLFLAACSYLGLLAFQAFIMWCAYSLGEPFRIRDARALYSTYEKAMYTDAAGVSHTIKNVHGHYRGIDGYFVPGNFANLGDEVQGNVCQMSLSQPLFTYAIITLWAITVTNRMKTNILLAVRVIMVENGEHLLDLKEDDTLLIQQLPIGLKIVLVFLVQLPTLVINFTLLILGTRLILATVGFLDILLNAVALEFVLNFSELFFQAFVPRKQQILVEKTALKEASTKGVVTVIMVLISFIYAYFHMFRFQEIIPGYKWDVHQTCVSVLNTLRVSGMSVATSVVNNNRRGR